MERLSADLGSGKRALRTEGNHSTTAKVQRNLSERNILKRNLSSLALNNLPSVEVVEAVVGEVDANAGGVFFGDGGDEDVGAVEELELVAEDGRVVWVVEEHGVDQGRAVDCLLVQGGVDVVEQAVADVVGVAGCFGNLGPVVKFLRDGAIAVVVSGEGVECLGKLLAWFDCLLSDWNSLPPRVAQREHRFSVVLPPNPQMSEPTYTNIYNQRYDNCV